MNNKEQKQPGEESLGMELNTDENINGNNHLNEPVTENSELDKLRLQVDELNDRYLRKVAEFDNFRRRTAKENLELRQTAGKEIITDLLDVLDDSERAQDQWTKTDDVNQIKEGVNLVFTKFKNTLVGKGLKAMESVGKEFNPDVHEAITEIEAGEEMKGKIVAEVQKGYYLNDKIIRFAKVVVGK